jgi:hypothetical protein
VLGSSDSLPPSLEAMLGLSEREDTPPEEDLGLEGLFWLPPDPEDQSHAVPLSDWSLGVPRAAWVCLEVPRNSDSETHRCVDY